MDDLDSMSLPVKLSIFAEDLYLYWYEKNTTTTSTLLQHAVDALELWLESSGFQFSANKFKVIRFSRWRKNHQIPKIRPNGVVLSIVNDLTILDLTFDSKLT